MTLPKVKTRKMIDKKEFAKLAKKVRESFRDEAEYLYKRRMENGNDSNSSSVPRFC